MPRAALGERPMTGAERQARRRQQFRQMQEDLARLRAELDHARATIERLRADAPVLPGIPPPDLVR